MHGEGVTFPAINCWSVSVPDFDVVDDAEAVTERRGARQGGKNTRSLVEAAPVRPAGMSTGATNNNSGFIWSVADLLRGDYKQSEYGKVILPFTVLRRLDCVLERTKPQVLARRQQLIDQGHDADSIAPVLAAVAKEQFYNTSPLDFRRLLDDSNQLAANLRAYIAAFSPGARDVLEKFDFDTQIARLDRANLLYLVLSKFAEIDLHPEKVSNIEMGYTYEELIRRFSELSNETAGEHFTPREVIRLMVNLLFIEDDAALTREGIVRTLFDPACGTGGMLSVAEDHLRSMNPKSQLEVFGQELNDETYAICRSDMMLKGQDASHIMRGNSFTEDGHKGAKFDYLLANPPFGVEWKKVESEIKREYEKDGFRGRFGAGLPRINDGSFLFLQHMISKMKPANEGGSRLAIVFNGSPLFTGAAGSGESEIRRWIIENDWLDAVVALPDQLFYNTGISTYFWVLTNRKSPERRGKVQLVDARESWTKMRKSLGNKRKEISKGEIDEITRLHGGFEEGERAKIFPNEAFGYQRITVERPLRLKSLDGSRPDAKALKEGRAERDQEAAPVKNRKGEPEPDPDLRDAENVPLPQLGVSWAAEYAERLESLEYRTAVNDYMAAEVLPYVPDAWVDHAKTKIGYEIPLTRHFYKYVPPRPLEQIDLEIRQLEEEIQKLLREVTE
jgi:type I restriction enzyme M protein